MNRFRNWVSPDPVRSSPPHKNLNWRGHAPHSFWKNKNPYKSPETLCLCIGDPVLGFLVAGWSVPAKATDHSHGHLQAKRESRWLPQLAETQEVNDFLQLIRYEEEDMDSTCANKSSTRQIKGDLQLDVSPLWFVVPRSFEGDKEATSECWKEEIWMLPAGWSFCIVEHDKQQEGSRL